MPGVRTERRLWHLGLIVIALGLVLSGLGVWASVSLLPFGILACLAGAVLMAVEAAQGLTS
jgi:hypothetical protein